MTSGLYIYMSCMYTIKPVLTVEVGKGNSVLCDLAFFGGEGGGIRARDGVRTAGPLISVQPLV